MKTKGIFDGSPEGGGVLANRGAMQGGRIAPRELVASSIFFFNGFPEGGGVLANRGEIQGGQERA